jgi:hypothetical protein
MQFCYSLFQPMKSKMKISISSTAMAEILVRLKNYGSLLVDSLETMRNEYVVAILHSALHIVRDNTKKEFSTRPIV